MSKAKRTEAEMLQLLRARHGQKIENSSAYAFVTHVRDNAGLAATRTLDAIALGLWPSRGMLLDGFEVKCSRADWLREHKDPSKAESFCRWLDRMWLVAADADIVATGELPERWGLLVAHGGSLTQHVEAKRLHDEPVPIPRNFLVPLLQCATRAAGDADDEARRAMRDEVERDVEASKEAEIAVVRRELERIQAAVEEFGRASGVDVLTYRRTPQRLGEAVAVVLSANGLIDDLRRHADRAVEDARRNAAMLQRQAADLEQQLRTMTAAAQSGCQEVLL